jgi:hypothetical protein
MNEMIKMADVFPALATISLIDAEPGSIIKIGRFDGPRLALVTDHIKNGVRSFVWLNPNFQNRPSAIFAENWQNDTSVLQYCGNVSFDLEIGDDGLDPGGRHFWETPGVLVSIGNDLFIRAAPEEEIYGRHKLINVRNGSVHSGRTPDSLWTILSWQLWIRDSLGQRSFMLTEFRATRKKAAS